MKESTSLFFIGLFLFVVLCVSILTTIALIDSMRAPYSNIFQLANIFMILWMAFYIWGLSLNGTNGAEN